MTIRITFSDKTVRVAVEINGQIESAIAELPSRTWVELNDLEIAAGSNYHTQWEGFMHGAHWAQEKLKERNHGL